jgi:hypothetical protein
MTEGIADDLDTMRRILKSDEWQQLHEYVSDYEQRVVHVSATSSFKPKRPPQRWRFIHYLLTYPFNCLKTNHQQPIPISPRGFIVVSIVSTAHPAKRLQPPFVWRTPRDCAPGVGFAR